MILELFKDILLSRFTSYSTHDPIHTALGVYLCNSISILSVNTKQNSSTPLVSIASYAMGDRSNKYPNENGLRLLLRLCLVCGHCPPYVYYKYDPDFRSRYKLEVEQINHNVDICSSFDYS
jgi:hypothetical protein